MSSFEDFLHWYVKKHFVPTLEALQKNDCLFHDRDVVVLNLGCTLPKLAKICLHMSTDTKLYPITEADKDLLEKIGEDVVGGPTIVFTREAVFDNFFSKVYKYTQFKCGDWC